MRADVPNPLEAKSDEEEPKKDKAKDKEKGDKDEKPCDADTKNTKSGGEYEAENENGDTESKDSTNEDEQESDSNKDDKKDKPKPVAIDLENMEARAFRLPIKRGQFRYMTVNDKNQIIYLRRGEENTLQVFDPNSEKREEKTILNKVNFVEITLDGKKLLVRSEGKTGIIDSKPDQKLGNLVIVEPMEVVIEPRQEWQQIFTDAWRFMRDYFYDPHMHGVDWPAIRRQYEAMLEDCVSRRDVGYVISEMISELNAGHTYYGGGDVDSGPRESVGYLGVDFQLDQGYCRVAKTYEGGIWDTDARSALYYLDEKDRKQFKYLFKVNGVSIDTSKAPWAAFEGLAGQTVVLTVGAAPDPDKATTVVVKLLGSEYDLRYRDWVE